MDAKERYTPFLLCLLLPPSRHRHGDHGCSACGGGGAAVLRWRLGAGQRAGADAADGLEQLEPLRMCAWGV